jgi:UDP-GlcNAc:undecaprenyl-phosphate/decaprenyl-phosphate GlcNAc-1-phosphate transferase
MGVDYPFLFISSFTLSIIFITILKKFSLEYNLLMPKGMPLIGGLGIGLTFILVLLLSFLTKHGLSKEAISIIISSGLMLIFGVIDDWRELSIWAKFLVQIIATGLLILFGIRTQIVYIGNILNIIITFIWVLGITNAFNHLDIMDGVTAGTAIIVSFSFFVISVLNADARTALLSLTLTGAILGFFLYNYPPAKIYMGNAGSHFLGFVLAATALIISYAPLERKIALLSPLVILGLPIFDTAFLILMRLIKKNLPFNKSNDHLALRFLALGYSKKKALFAMLKICLFFCLSAMAISQLPNSWGIGITVLVILITLFIAFRMSKIAVNE